MKFSSMAEELQRGQRVALREKTLRQYVAIQQPVDGRTTTDTGNVRWSAGEWLVFTVLESGGLWLSEDFGALTTERLREDFDLLTDA